MRNTRAMLAMLVVCCIYNPLLSVSVLPQVWDLRKNAVLYRMKGHSDTVTGMTLSPDGSYLLTNAMDNSLRIWDVRPFAPSERCLKILTGHQHNFEKVGIEPK